ncbi:type IVB secretion system protein IcmJDotN [soil metagenome]
MNLEIILQPGAYRLFAARKADPAFAKFSQRILRRDNNTCQFCGFQAKTYQEVVNVDQNYYNNKVQNLVTACCFCTQCFFLESIGVSYGGGTLIYLPEVNQASLDSFCHVIFCAITNDTGYKSSAQAIYRSLKFRSQAVENQFGEESSVPAIFAQMLIESYGNNLEMSKPLLANLRLLPSRAKFAAQIEHWAATALEELSTEEF